MSTTEVPEKVQSLIETIINATVGADDTAEAARKALAEMVEAQGTGSAAKNKPAAKVEIPADEPEGMSLGSETIKRPNGSLYHVRKLGLHDDVSVLREARDKQLPVMAYGCPGTGKALSYSTPVLTPKGWTTASEVSVGDRLVGRNGLSTKVLVIHPQPKKDMYRVTTSDGVSIEVCGEHLWQVRTTRNKANRTRGEADWEVLTTEQILSAGLFDHNETRRTWELPMLTAPVQYDSGLGKLVLDPYTLGVILGDGKLASNTKGVRTFKNTSKARIFTDLEILEKIFAEGIVEQPGCYLGKIDVPNSLGIRGTRSWEKFIPQEYMLASPEERLELLRGLMDTDGNPTRTAAEFSTASEELADNVVELVQSLGGTAKMTSRTTFYTYKGVRKAGRVSYRIRVKMPTGVNPFKLSRKADKFVGASKYPVRRFIQSIEPIGQDVSVCFTVDSPDALFVVDGFVVTHNTALIEAAYCLDGKSVHTVQGTGDTETADFIGSYTQTGGGTFEWNDGPLLKAMDEGSVLYIDEIALIDPKVMAVVYSVMDGRGELQVTQNPSRGTVTAQEGFYIAAACNPNAPGARLSEAILSRFVLQFEVTTDYALARKLGVPQKMVNAAQNMMRKLEDGSVGFAWQLRELLAAKDIQSSFGEDFALRNMISVTPEIDRPVAQEVLSKTYGKNITELTVD